MGNVRIASGWPQAGGDCLLRLPGDGRSLEQLRGAGAPLAPYAARRSAAVCSAWPVLSGGGGGGVAGQRDASGETPASPAAGAGSRVRAALAGAAAVLAAGLLSGPGVEYVGPYSELGPPGLRLLQLGYRPAGLLGAHRLRALLRFHVADGQEG